MIDGNEKRICPLIFEFYSPHVIERRSNDIKIRRGSGRLRNYERQKFYLRLILLRKRVFGHKFRYFLGLRVEPNFTDFSQNTG